jgi:hypothetical protein
MAHYAFLDENNVVTEVIVGKDEGEGGVNWETHYGNFRGQTCKRTSYNTYGNQHRYGGVPFRKNYAGIGYSYDETNDAFIAPKPFESWVLNSSTFLWEAPVSKPLEGLWKWDEETTSWVLME